MNIQFSRNRQSAITHNGLDKLTCLLKRTTIDIHVSPTDVYKNGERGGT